MHIIFVCHGNICRSPMAEFIMKNLCKDSSYVIESRATSFEEIGNDLYYLTKETLLKHHIPFTKHCAKRITIDEFNKADYVIVMDDNNLYNLKRIVGPINKKIYKLLEFCGSNNDVQDPWYSRNFELCYKQINYACINLYNKVKEK